MMKNYRNDPIRAWANGVQLAALLVEAQAVIAMRVMGMAGVWSTGPNENHRMVSEKVYALSKATRDAAAVALTGAGPEATMAAAIKPLRQKTRANTRRLVKRGTRRIR